MDEALTLADVEIDPQRDDWRAYFECYSVRAQASPA
jgi:hypothetical protein